MKYYNNIKTAALAKIATLGWNTVQTFNTAKWETYEFPYGAVYIPSEETDTDYFVGSDVGTSDLGVIDFAVYAGFELSSVDNNDGTFDTAANEAIHALTKAFRGLQILNINDADYSCGFDDVFIAGKNRIFDNSNKTKGVVAIHCKVGIEVFWKPII